MVTLHDIAVFVAISTAFAGIGVALTVIGLYRFKRFQERSDVLMKALGVLVLQETTELRRSIQR
jgi:hypothetical protein